jgi:hypothetical protein
MAKLAWAVLCQQAMTDATSNQISLMNILEEITLVAFEDQGQMLVDSEALKTTSGHGMSFQLCSFWLRDDADVPEFVEARAEVKSPKGRTLVNQEFAVDLNQFQRLRSFVKFLSVPLDGPNSDGGGPLPGVYTFKVQKGKRGSSGKITWQTLSEQYLHIKVSPQVAPAAAIATRKKPTKRTKTR